MRLNIKCLIKVQTGQTHSQHQCVTSWFFVKGYGSQNHDWLIWWKIGGTI